MKAGLTINFTGQFTISSQPKTIQTTQNGFVRYFNTCKPKKEIVMEVNLLQEESQTSRCFDVGTTLLAKLTVSQHWLGERSGTGPTMTREVRALEDGASGTTLAVGDAEVPPGGRRDGRSGHWHLDASKTQVSGATLR